MKKKQLGILTALAIALILTGLALLRLAGMLPGSPYTNESEVPAVDSIKYVSVLGDSISTFKGVTDNGLLNSTIDADYLARYALTSDFDNTLVKLPSVDDTWWMRVINEYDMKLLVNNAWRGTKVVDTEKRAGCGARCENLHDDTLADNPGNVAIDPDVILVYMGTNDYLQKVEPGEFDPAYMDQFAKQEDGTYTYPEPETFAQGYTIMIHKILTRYPQADVFCFTLLPMTYKVDGVKMGLNNRVIRAAAEYFQLELVDLYGETGITWANANLHVAKDGIHPNMNGIKKIAACLRASFERRYGPPPVE